MNEAILSLSGLILLAICALPGGAQDSVRLRSDFAVVNEVRLNYLGWPGPEGVPLSALFFLTRHALLR